MCELCWISADLENESAAKSGKKYWWDNFASVTFAFDPRVWGSVGCGDAWGSRWRNWLFLTDFSGDFTPVVLILCLLFLK